MTLFSLFSKSEDFEDFIFKTLFLKSTKKCQKSKSKQGFAPWFLLLCSKTTTFLLLFGKKYQ